MLADELGYEDTDEFEDALKSSFADFIGALPHIETRNLESELQPGLFRDVFRVIPDPPPEECTPQRLVLKIETRADLWRVLMLHPGTHALLRVSQIPRLFADCPPVITVCYIHHKCPVCPYMALGATQD